MKGSLARLTLSIFTAVLLVSAPVAVGQKIASTPRVIRPKTHDVSPPLRDIVASAPNLSITGEHQIKNRRLSQIPGGNAQSGEDKALQAQVLPLVNTSPGLNFDGISSDGYAPPDTNGAVGATQFVQMTNVEYAVYDKVTGNLDLGPALISTVWRGFNGDCAQGDGGDPVVVYDKAAQRWVLSELNINYNAWCMAVSTSSDATGSYYRYEFNFGNNLPDYPKLGVWPDGYYWSANTFNGSTFLGSDVCAFDRPLMLTGGAANAICLQQSPSVGGLLPSDMDGTNAPPAGAPNFYVELLDTSDLGLFKFHVDFSNPANSTFTGPTSIPVASFSEACGGGVCIPQPDPSQQLDSVADRLMFRLAYRNFGDHEALVVTHSVTAGTSVGVRWYEIRSPGGTPEVFQQGTFAPDTNYRWMGSAAMDMAGDIAMGYSISSSSVAPGIRYTGRQPSDPAGTMQTETSIIDGTGSQVNGLERWGDYSSMSVDPLDDCTFWYTTEYIATTGSYNWNTRIASFKFGNCGNSNPGFYLSATPPSQTVLTGHAITYTLSVNSYNGYNGTVGLTLSGCPQNATCTFSPSSSGSPNYPPSTLTVSTSSALAAGNYLLTVTGTDGTITHTAELSLVVVAPDFSLTSNTKVETINAGTSARFPISLTPLNGFSGNVTLAVSGLPYRSTATFTPNPVTVTSNNANSLLTVATKKRSKAGTYTLKITGTDGSIKRSTSVTLIVTP